MRAKVPGESVQTVTGKRYTAGADRIVHDVSQDDVAELARLGWRRMVAAVAQSVVAIAVTTERGTTIVTTPARNRPLAAV